MNQLHVRRGFGVDVCRQFMVEGFGFGCLGKGMTAERAIAVGKANCLAVGVMGRPVRVPIGGCEAGGRVGTDVEHGSDDKNESSEGAWPQFGLASLRG